MNASLLSVLVFLADSDSIPKDSKTWSIIFGGVLILISLVAGTIKLPGIEVAGAAGKWSRVAAFICGLYFVGLANPELLKEQIKESQTVLPPAVSLPNAGASLPAPPSVTPPVQPQYQWQCFFEGDPTAYFITAQNEIIAQDPASGQTRIVGSKLPPQVPAAAWTYSTPNGACPVDFQGQIWDPYMTMPVGRAVPLR